MSPGFLFGYCKYTHVLYVSQIMQLWEKNIFDNIDIEICISQQRASITSTALVLTIQLWQLSAVSEIYKIKSIHLQMQRWCNDSVFFISMPWRYGWCTADISVLSILLDSHKHRPCLF